MKQLIGKRVSYGWRQLLSCALGLLALATSAAGANASDSRTSAWPEIPLPPNAEVYRIGDRIDLNGLPMRLRGFSADTSPERTAAWFRDHLPRPMVENKVGDRLVLGRASGYHYITVQLAPEGSGTKGIVGITDVRAALERRAAGSSENEKLLSAMPSGTKLLNSMSSADAGRNSTFVVLANTYAEQTNADRVKRMLGAEGLELERETRAADAGAQTLAALPRGAAGGRTLFFRGKGREAIAVVSRMPDNRVVIVINTITAIESFK